MNKKILAILMLSFFIVTSVILLLNNDDEWLINEQSRVIVYDKDYPSLKANERIMDVLSSVDYAAIIYSEASLTYPNSWFHKHILGNPYEGTSYKIKGNVEYTIIGKKYDSIIYNSSGYPLQPYPLFVGLCESENDVYYAPDNGYEFPATQEAIEFLKSIDRNSIKKSNLSVCLN